MARIAEEAVRLAKYEAIALLDSDAHPMQADWLALTVDKMDAQHPLAGAIFRDKHEGNPHGWYIHPHFMTFFQIRPGKTHHPAENPRPHHGHRRGSHDPRAGGREGNPRLPHRVLQGALRGPSPRAHGVRRGLPCVVCDPAFQGAKHRGQGDRGAVSRENYMYPLQEMLRKTYNLNY